MASPTWHELRYGVFRLPKGKRRVDSITNMLPLVTANPKAFRGFKGLSLLNWASS